MALYFALKKIGKHVQIVNVDATPKKYRFLKPENHITIFEEHPELQLHADLVVIFDTNDERLLNPLFPVLKKGSLQIVFVDHHPTLTQGPQPTPESWIDVQAASTGEMTYKLIKALEIPLDKDIATALYTSITFDTQLYRYIRGSSTSHLIAADLLNHDIDTETVHRHLFGNFTTQKISFLAMALGQIEYFHNGKVALLKIKDKDMIDYKLEMDESRDIVDMIMNIESIEAAILIREDAADAFKISLRSKGKYKVLPVAESIGGGGHAHSAGAYVRGNYDEIKLNLLTAIEKHFS